MLLVAATETPQWLVLVICMGGASDAVGCPMQLCHQQIPKCVVTSMYLLGTLDQHSYTLLVLESAVRQWPQ